LVARVRAFTGAWQPHLNTEGNYTALIEFEDGTPATLVFNGYGYFNITDLTWGIGEGGRKIEAIYDSWQPPTGPVDAATLYGVGGRPRRTGSSPERYQPIFGLTIVSCERGDIRQSPNGLFVYSQEGCEEILCPPYEDRGAELRELAAAVTEGRRAFPDGRWGRATLEVILAILRSSQARRAIEMTRQVSAPL
jgi:phthalate 4,5-cis-dihydrodiol dehydrogenase